MTSAAEARIRAAVAELGDALVAAVTEQSGSNGDDDLLDASLACRRLGGIARSTLYELTRAGDIRSVSVGRRRFWPKSYLAEYVADQSSLGEAK